MARETAEPTSAEPDPDPPARLRPRPAAELLDPAALKLMADAIADAGGHEVFFVGELGPGPLITDVTVLARGNSHQVPAIMEAAARADVAIHNHPGGDLTPSDADLNIASALGNAGTGFWIVNNAVSEVHVVVEARREPETIPVEPEEVEEVLGAGGSISRAMPGYEEREGQLAMARGVAAGLSDRRLVLCEAGTGTGKTFAYLVPAVLWAVRNKATVVVSTGTINLQEQIAEKDVPFLQQGFLPDFRAVLVKGRGNYVSLRRAREAAKLGADAFESEEERAATEDLIEWAESTERGDRNELVPAPHPDAWERVESQADNCLGSRCPSYRDCHFYRTRREAKQAQILIVNHHLLFADLAAKAEIGNFNTAAVLPPYDRLILDEAHKVEEVASAWFGTTLSEAGMLKRLGRLMSLKKRNKGLLASLESSLAKIPVSTAEDEQRLSDVASIIGVDLRPLVRSTGEAVRVLFGIARDAPLLREATAEGAGTSAGRGARNARILPQPRDKEDELWRQDLAETLRETRLRITRLVKKARFADEILRDVDGPTLAPLTGRILEFRSKINRLEAAGRDMLHFARYADDDHVRWIELARRNRKLRASLKTAPLVVGPILREQLWEKLKAGVLASATLRTDRGFAFMRDELGLRESVSPRVDELTVPSPFDFKAQCRLLLPNDHSEPRAPGFLDDTCYVIDRLTEITEGRAFLLFTSYRFLESVYRRLAGPLQDRGLTLFKQGELSRGELLQRFRSTAGAVLFGTDSFWEGVDVPGRALELVVVTKMPFRVPSEPLQEARAERIEKNGGVPFVEMTLPQAILKLRQGFGRLIRSRSDRGLVALLDRRVLTRRYGESVLSALPPVTRVIGRFEADLLPEAEAFFGVTPAASKGPAAMPPAAEPRALAARDRRPDDREEPERADRAAPDAIREAPRP